MNTVIERVSCGRTHYHPSTRRERRARYPKNWAMVSAIEKAERLKQVFPWIDISHVPAIAESIVGMSECTDGLTVTIAENAIWGHLDPNVPRKSNPPLWGDYLLKVLPIMFQALDKALREIGLQLIDRFHYILDTMASCVFANEIFWNSVRSAAISTEPMFSSSRRNSVGHGSVKQQTRFKPPFPKS